VNLAEILESECLRLGVIKESLTVLTEESDPYRQSTEKFHTMGRWFAEQVERDFAGRASHIRGIHYAIVARGDIMRPDGTPYINNAECWEWLLKAAPAARWLGYLGFDRIIDGRNSDPVLITREDLADSTLTIDAEFEAVIPSASEIGVNINGARDLFVSRQPYQIVFFAEKASLDEVLTPLAQRYKADLYLNTGEMTTSNVYAMAKRAVEDGRPMVLFTLSDFDPSGWQMPVSIGRKLQAFRDMIFPDLKYEVVPVALNADQVRDLNLPSTPLKEEELRADNWREAFDHEQTEIDALATLRPDALREIIEAAVKPFFDDTLAARVFEAWGIWSDAANTVLNEKIGARVADIRERADAYFDEVREQVENLLADLDAAAEEVDPDELPLIEIPEPEIAAAGQARPLISSEMSWADATRALIVHKRYGVADELKLRKTWASSGNPWEALGISRSKWYRDNAR
jgi:hypothetical protein